MTQSKSRAATAGWKALLAQEDGFLREVVGFAKLPCGKLIQVVPMPEKPPDQAAIVRF
jgi:hypothetical protein